MNNFKVQADLNDQLSNQDSLPVSDGYSVTSVTSVTESIEAAVASIDVTSVTCDNTHTNHISHMSNHITQINPTPPQEGVGKENMLSHVTCDICDNNVTCDHVTYDHVRCDICDSNVTSDPCEVICNTWHSCKNLKPIDSRFQGVCESAINEALKKYSTDVICESIKVYAEAQSEGIWADYYLTVFIRSIKGGLNVFAGKTIDDIRKMHNRRNEKKVRPKFSSTPPPATNVVIKKSKQGIPVLFDSPYSGNPDYCDKNGEPKVSLGYNKEHFKLSEKYRISGGTK